MEWGEIQEANLTPGEDEELEQRYRLMVNSKRILESLAESYQLTGNEMDGGLAEFTVAKAVQYFQMFLFVKQ